MVSERHRPSPTKIPIVVVNSLKLKNICLLCENIRGIKFLGNTAGANMDSARVLCAEVGAGTDPNRFVLSDDYCAQFVNAVARLKECYQTLKRVQEEIQCLRMQNE